MISIILYGRNDSYGYNLHKRVALSLNTMSEVLSDPEDEILFVDYNTPDDFPTLPEAIADTLTEKTKKYLKVLRVRPRQHKQFEHLTHLMALEPISRNVALRRSNPKNRWILSSNTDMIFVPQGNFSLSDIISGLPDGHYGIPRMEVPETLWEQLDRKDPKSVISEVEHLGWRFHLNECVYGELPHKFDAPGDFQLMLRQDLFDIDGFDERMLIGWHVDSNIAKRMSFLRGEVGELTDQLLGYHCDHTRQITPMHKAGSAQNSIEEFITEISQPDLPHQREVWGLNGEEVEEITLLNQSNSYLSVLEKTIPKPQTQITTSYYRNGCYDINQKGTKEHILPFLYDLFSSRTRDTKITWVGEDEELFESFEIALAAGGFQNKPEFINIVDISEHAISDYDSIIIDFNFDTPQPHAEPTEDNSALYMNFFIEECLRERMRLEQEQPPRQFVGINTVANRYETLFLRYIGAAKTPFNIRLRHGYLLQNSFEEYFSQELVVKDWTDQLHVGGAGNLGAGNRIHSIPETPGHVCFGPYDFLTNGEFMAEITISGKSLKKQLKKVSSNGFFAEIVSGDTPLGNSLFTIGSRNKASANIKFDSSPEGISTSDRLNGVQIRICTDGKVHFVIESVKISLVS